MISVIIPVLNEETALPLCLETVFRQSGEFEVIVVDGGSDDNTINVTQQYPALRLIHSQKGRALQMNAGAAIARGEWLVFLHADTRLPDNGLETILSLSSNSKIKAGCFRHRFSGEHWLLRAISTLHNWRCRRSRVIYGDQCLFLRHSLFSEVNGFPDADILEDVLLSEEIIQRCYPVILDAVVITDSRKFEQRGIIRSFCEVFLIMSCYELGLPITGKGFFSPVR